MNAKQVKLLRKMIPQIGAEFRNYTTVGRNNKTAINAVNSGRARYQKTKAIIKRAGNKLKRPANPNGVL